MHSRQNNQGLQPSDKQQVVAFYWAGVILVLWAFALQTAPGAETDGFTEPYRTIHVAAAETGIIMQLNVREGDRVEAGQVLAALDDDVHRAMLAIAQQNMEARGRLEAAMADYQLRAERLRKFEQLLATGYARQEEVDRARAELAVAEGQVTAAREELAIRKLEYAKIKTQLERRMIRSPIDGVVSELLKETGEFVAPTTPDVLTIVQLDPLLAVFSLPRPLADQLSEAQQVHVLFPESGRRAEGTVELIAPVTDAESGTVRVKVRIANRDGQYRSGERCVLQIPRRGRQSAR